MRAPLLFLLRWFLLPLQLFFFCLLRDSLHTVCVSVCVASLPITHLMVFAVPPACLRLFSEGFNVRLWVRAFTFTLQQFLFLSLWLNDDPQSHCVHSTPGSHCWTVLLSLLKQQQKVSECSSELYQKQQPAASHVSSSRAWSELSAERSRKPITPTAFSTPGCCRYLLLYLLQAWGGRNQAVFFNLINK